MFNTKTPFQAAAYQRAMDHLFVDQQNNLHNLIQFQAAGKVAPVQPTESAKAWAERVLGAQLKPAYENVPVSGLLLLRDSLVNQFASAN